MLQRLCRLDQRAGGVDHVVDDHAGATLHVADDVHHLGHVGLRPPLVDDHQVCLETAGHRTGAHHAAGVRGHHAQVLVVALPHVAEQDRQAVDVVDRDIEKALDLVGVKVHRQYAIDADALQHVGDDLRGDRHPRRTRPAVLPGVSEIGDGSGDPRGRRALERIDHRHQFHQVVVRGRAGRLQHEHVLAAYVLEQFDHGLAVAEHADAGAPEMDVQVAHDALGQLAACGPRENHQPVIGHGPSLRRAIVAVVAVDTDAAAVATDTTGEKS